MLFEKEHLSHLKGYSSQIILGLNNLVYDNAGFEAEHLRLRETRENLPIKEGINEKDRFLNQFKELQKEKSELKEGSSGVEGYQEKIKLEKGNITKILGKEIGNIDSVASKFKQLEDKVNKLSNEDSQILELLGLIEQIEQAVNQEKPKNEQN